MAFDVIDGGSENKIPKEKAKEQIFTMLQILRLVENKMSILKRISESVGLDYLTHLATDGHIHTRRMLGYIKKEQKGITERIEKKPDLKIIEKKDPTDD